MKTALRFLAPLCAVAFLHCGSELPDDLGEGNEVAEGLDAAQAAAVQNPAPFNLNCLYRGENFAMRAPNQTTADAIRFACDVQAALIPYKAPGFYPLQDRMPTKAEGTDCSGLSSNAYFRASRGAIKLPHSAAMQEKMLKEVSIFQLLPGDLIFYVSSSALSGRHVAMYIGDGKMIEAWGSNVGITVNNVRTDRLSSARRVK